MPERQNATFFTATRRTSPHRSRVVTGGDLPGTILNRSVGAPAIRGAGTVVDGGAFGPHPSVVCSAEEALGLTRRGPAAFPVEGLDPLQDGARHADVRYLDQGEIGRGGMGTVHRTFDRVLMRNVAMKMIEPSASAAELGTRFVEEAQITGQLDHPNIVPVYEFGTVGASRSYFTMKLVSGQTLSQVIAALHGGAASGGKDSARLAARPETALREKTEALERVVRILLKVCEAVSFAHSRGVIHRDLKPANIMIGTHGQVYVMDWGLGLLQAGRRSTVSSTASDSVRTSVRSRRADGVEGTISYMAPEQALGNATGIDARTDVFALGAILYEALTQRPPYVAATTHAALLLAAAARITSPQEVTAEPLPPGLCEIAMRAMSRDPAERYQTVDEMHDELERFLRGGGWFATRVFAPGQIIVREGDQADAAYLIVRGRCLAFREEANGERKRLRLMGPGEVFGETALLSAALLSAQRRAASVAAIDVVTVKVVTAAALEREMDRSSWMHAVVKQLATRVLDLEQQQR